MKRMFDEKEIIKYVNDGAEEVVVDELKDGGKIAIELAKKANLAGANFTGNISAPKVSGNEIIENMGSEYTYYIYTTVASMSVDTIYAGVCKNGNKLTGVLFLELERTSNDPAGVSLGYFTIPKAVADKIYPFTLGVNENIVYIRQIQAYSDTSTKVDLDFRMEKGTESSGIVPLNVKVSGFASLTLNTKYLCRVEVTFLLSDNLIPSNE